MKAIWYDQFNGTPLVKDVPVPTLHSDAVLIKVVSTGLCRSDWHGWKGHDPDIKLPHVPGHEFSGEIVELGSQVSHWDIGQRVTTPFIQACGACYFCQTNNQQVCQHQEQAGFTCWGSFAEYVEVRYADTNLVQIPDYLSFDEAAVLGCRFGTAYRALVDQARVMAGQWLAVFGCGGVGLAAIMIARVLGVRIIAIDPSPIARKRASKLGAWECFSRLNAELLSFLAQHNITGVDVTLDAIGSQEVMLDAFAILKRRGQHIQVGLFPAQTQTVSLPVSKIVAFEQELKGSHGIQAFRYASMFELIKTKSIPLRDLIAQQVSLKEAIPMLVNFASSRHAGVTLINPG